MANARSARVLCMANVCIFNLLSVISPPPPSRNTTLTAAVHYSFTKSLEYQVAWSKRGANLIMHSADVKLACQQLSSDLATIRSGNGDAAKETGEVEGV